MAAWPSRDKVNFRLPWTNSCISAKLSRSKFFMLIVIHQQDALFRLAHVQAHLALETISHFRLIPHWKRPPCPGSSRIGQFSPLTAIMICYTMPDLIHDGPFRRAPNGPCSGVPCPNTRQVPDPNEPSDFRSRQYKATRLLYLRLTSYAS